jgi:hypothetical protein
MVTLHGFAVQNCFRLSRLPPLGCVDVLIFMWMAGDIGTRIYYTGIDRFTKEQVYIAKQGDATASCSVP